MRRARPPTRDGRIYSVAVDPEHQGHGLGAALLRRAIAAVFDQGIDTIYLEVRLGNVQAMRAYDRLGFVPRRLLPNYYGEGRHGVSMRMVKPK